MMKKMLLILPLFVFVSFTMLFAISNEFASVEIISTGDIVQSDDYIEIRGDNFTPNDRVLAVLMTMLDEENRIVANVFLDEYNLQIDTNGILRGIAKIVKIAQPTVKFEILIFTENTDVKNSNSLVAKGLDATQPDGPLSLGVAIITESGTGFPVDGIAQNGEVFNCSGGGWGTSTLLTTQQVEYTDLAGTVYNGQSAFQASTAALINQPTANLTGTVTTTATYMAGTRSIRGQFITTIFEVGTSNVLPTPDIIPPDIDSTYAFTLDTIRIVFNEPVNEVGARDAAYKLELQGIGGVSVSSIEPVGSQPTTDWNLVISGLTDRSVTGLQVRHDSTNVPSPPTPTATLEDAATNEVLGNPGAWFNVADSIPPNVTQLRTADNLDTLSVGEFLDSTTYTLRARVQGGTADGSLDGVLFEGSDNGTSWTSLGTDGIVDDVDFSVTWNIQTQGRFKMLRARAFDNAGSNGANNVLDSDDNVTPSLVIGSATNGANQNFEDTYRARIITVDPSSIGQSSGAIRAAIVVQMSNNYGDVVNTIGSQSFTVSESTTSTESWWSVATGGSGNPTSITLSFSSGVSTDTVWYSNTAAGGPNTLVLLEVGDNFSSNQGVVSANGQTVTVTISKIVNVSNPSPSVDANVDTSSAAGDLLLQVDVDDGEDTGDDFRIKWGFSEQANPTPSQIFQIGTSGDLSPPEAGGTIQHTVPASTLQGLTDDPYIYMFFWLENVTTTPDSSFLDGFPIITNRARLILNAKLITAGGDNGADAAGGDFTPGVNNQEVVSIKFNTTPVEAVIKIGGLVFDYTQTSTADENDLSTWHLYRDVSTIGTYDSGFDVLLDDVTVTPSMTSVNFSGISPVLNIGASDTIHVLVTVDVKSGANGNHILGLKLSGPNSINFASVEQFENNTQNPFNKNDFTDLGTSQDYSLPVTLISFKAVPSYAKIVLEWLTASEENNAGFYLMRADEKAGDYRRLNEQLIEGNGNTSVTHYYQFEDTDVEIEQTYYYKLFSVDFNGDVYEYPTIAAGAAVMLPQSFSLKQNFPNPFNPTTKMSFDVPQESNVKLEVYNMLGQKIRTLVDGRLQPGIYQNVIWDAKDDRGNSIANGIYYLVFTADAQNIKQVRKMVFMK